MSDARAAARLAEQYYDSKDADAFYFHVWGGEDIHIGLYETRKMPIREASQRTVEVMAGSLKGLSPDTCILDLGAGYGGAARYLAKRYGCHVTCLNLSETQNSLNRSLTSEAELADKVRVVHGNFEQVPEPDAGYDVVWSQDAFLHSGDRMKVMREAHRLLKPGGSLLFTDPMQANQVPAGVLEPVLQRIHLPSLGSFDFYTQAAAELGMEVVQAEDFTEHLVTHYARVREELESRRPELEGAVSSEYMDRMLVGLGHWVEAGGAGHLSWGILQFRLPD